MGKTLVIGLDGASWDLINPWIEGGKLPTIEKLIKEGGHGILKSTNPPVTGPAWVSFATGKNPGKHGCYGFFLPKGSLSKTESITTRDIKGETFYQLLDRQGKKCILVNLPCSYPPRIQGILITDFLTKGDNFFFPPNLVAEISELKDYRIVPRPNLKGENFVADVSDLEKKKFDCARQLFQKDWDFFFILFDVPDSILHRVDEKIIPGKKVAALKILEEIDNYVKWFIDHAPDANIFIMSDHGFRSYNRVFSINEWLVSEGYAKVGVKSIESKIEDSSFLERKQVSNWIQRLVSQLLKRRIPLQNQFLMKLASFLYRIITKVTRLRRVVQITLYPESSAYSLTYAGNYASIYLNSREKFEQGVVENREELRAEIMSKLEKLEDDSGNKIFVSVLKGEDVYFGESTDMAPDIILMASDNYNLIGVDPARLHNAHALEGIFITYGANIKNGAEVDVEIIDLAPTILHCMGMPIPVDIDGRVLEEIFKEDSEPANRKPRFRSIQSGEVQKIRGKIGQMKRQKEI